MKKQSMIIVAMMLSVWTVAFPVNTQTSPLASHKRGQNTAKAANPTPAKQGTAAPVVGAAAVPVKTETAGQVLAQNQAAPTQENDVFDIEAKRKAVIALVDQAQAYLAAHTTEESFHAFSNDKSFVKGELYLFVFDSQGICFAHGEENALIWQNLYDLQDAYGTPFIQNMIAQAHTGGGWMAYEWRGASKVTYVKQVIKDGTTYILGCGYYPHSKEDAVINLVRGAVSFFNETVHAGRLKEEAFSFFSYGLGRFILGDLYLYAVDFSGLHYAQGELPEVIGTSGWEYRDANGKLVNQEIINKLKLSDVGIWVEYQSKNALKRTYAEKVKDADGKEYFIACGYYPTADRNKMVNLVREGYQYMKANGKSQAVRRFTDKRDLEFRYGDLSLFVYDMQGVCIAHGGNPGYVGLKQLDQQDTDGRYYVREMIEKAQAQPGGDWIAYKVKNSFQVSYIERVDLGVDAFVIGSSMYPVSKLETMLLLAKSAASYLRTHSKVEAFNEFAKKDSKFIRGDLSIDVFNVNGICLVYGDDHDLIWHNMLQYKDDVGSFFVQAIVDVAKQTSGKVYFTLNGVRKTAYIEGVEKDGMLYAVGSSYYH